jgi:hypothetical protein
MISLTVALPIWNSKRIAWLPFEGLCNQKKITFDWELLIAEEQINHFGAEEISKFSERLQDVGCVSMRYFPLDYRIPLAQKWKFLAEKTSKSSKIFLLQAADCYPESLRLSRTMDKVKEGYDWIQNRCTYMYSLHYKNVIEFDQSTFGPGCKCGANMAVSTDLIKNLPNSFETSGIDNWLLKQTAPKNICWIDGSMPDGLDVDGLNNISFARRRNFEITEPPFKKTDKKISDIVPEYIADRLKKTAPR